MTVVVKDGSVRIPLLDNKSGNSHYKDHIGLLSKLVKVIGKERVGVILGDREFISIDLVKCLKINDLNFLQVYKVYLVILKKMRFCSIKILLNTQKNRYFKDCKVDEVCCNIMIKCLLYNNF